MRSSLVSISSQKNKRVPGKLITSVVRGSLNTLVSSVQGLSLLSTEEKGSSRDEGLSYKYLKRHI